ncbi:response regulator [Yoonia sp.]|uniref:response regulator n=1 Tax=Yoonia sp. TaxID=2212373 RepID=UPI001A0A7AA9|nr:response regulator [Yoonia sp.]MBE0413584.1 response regulator [Yoonia sp.]
MDVLNELLQTRAPTAQRPLMGLTVLLVEDSRFASEALRLLCQRSGARIRRADSLEHAKRHLAVYRPSVLMVDVGLPDGSGLALIAAVARATPRIDVILGISGDTLAQESVIAAGADGFLEKPIASLARFQAAILDHLPDDQRPPGPRLVSDETVNPDLVAYHDDLIHIAKVLAKNAAGDIAYITQFLDGVARSARDDELAHAVHDLARHRKTGANLSSCIARLLQIVQNRIAASAPI